MAAAAAAPPALTLAVAAAVIAAACLLLCAEAVWLDLPQSGTKCVSEEIQSNVVVLADYALMLHHHMETPYITMKMLRLFAFTTSEAGNYLACFWIDSAEKGSGISINLDWKIGIAAKDWDVIAKKEKIELRKLEVAVQSIHQNMIYLKAREAEMRTVSEKTNARVAWFSILSLSVCIVVSILQLWHLQGYFQKKKLI
uniref:GOLD domain-containing protein n=1 Tax=Oryza meridionalis TaxID=40149 RepID=A0A0E0CRZ3_9ORYZ